MTESQMCYTEQGSQIQNTTINSLTWNLRKGKNYSDRRQIRKLWWAVRGGNWPQRDKKKLGLSSCLVMIVAVVTWLYTFVKSYRTNRTNIYYKTNSNLLYINYIKSNQILEKEMATHSSILAWKIPWTKEPGKLQSMG